MNGVRVKSPCRMSLMGGGTDLPVYFKNRVGRIFSVGIDRYITIECCFLNLEEKQRYCEKLNNKSLNNAKFIFDAEEFSHWSSVESIDHHLLKQILTNYLPNLQQVNPAAVVLTVRSDVPSGTGLGSSSSFVIGVIAALRKMFDLPIDHYTLAQEAIAVEVTQLGAPIGVQDHYAASFGGFLFMQVRSLSSVQLQQATLPEDYQRYLRQRLMILYTGRRRQASQVYAKAVARAADNMSLLDGMGELAAELFAEVNQQSTVDKVAAVLNRGWELKRSMAQGVSDEEIDNQLARALRFGALGGKLMGAGGGGHLLLVAEPENQRRLLEELKLKQVSYEFQNRGCHFI